MIILVLIIFTIYASIVWLYVVEIVSLIWLILLIIAATAFFFIALVIFTISGLFTSVGYALYEKNQGHYKEYRKNNWESRFRTLGLNINTSLSANDIPKTLYKYRDWDNPYSRTVLEQNQAYFSSPIHFNDPFDSRIPIRLDHLNEHELNQFIDDYIEVFAREIQDDPKEALDSPYTFRKTSKSRLRNSQYRDLIKINSKNQEIFSQSDLDCFGIYCLSEKRDDVLMWSHYSKNHEGICVGFNTSVFYQELLENRDNSNYHLLEFRDVNYLESFPAIKAGVSSTIGTDIFFSKAKNWEYEKEWRALIHFYDKINRVITFSEECIEEVYLGCKMVNKESVTSDILSLNPQLKIYWAEKKNLSFNLEFRRVN